MFPPPSAPGAGVNATAPTLEALLKRLWSDYAAITPVAARVRGLLSARQEQVRNDHIALRTFDLEPIGLDALAAPFIARGYAPTGEYRFEDKKLRARSYSPVTGDAPRVFISELCCSEFPPKIQQMLRGIVDTLDPRALSSEAGLLSCTPSWPAVSYELYGELLTHTQYGAWVAAFGLRANHFTVHANDLRGFRDLAALNDFLRECGERLNGEAQPIQGSVSAGLEQSSTVADKVTWTFADGVREQIPSCYYEFAWRHPGPTGELFDGFVTKNADKIFESTDTHHHSSS